MLIHFEYVTIESWIPEFIHFKQKKTSLISFFEERKETKSPTMHCCHAPYQKTNLSIILNVMAKIEKSGLVRNSYAFFSHVMSFSAGRVSALQIYWQLCLNQNSVGSTNHSHGCMTPGQDFSTSGQTTHSPEDSG